MEEGKIILENIDWFATAGIIFFAASEIIALNPKWKSNSVIQIIGAILGRVFKKQ